MFELSQLLSTWWTVIFWNIFRTRFFVVSLLMRFFCIFFPNIWNLFRLCSFLPYSIMFCLVLCSIVLLWLNIQQHHPVNQGQVSVAAKATKTMNNVQKTEKLGVSIFSLWQCSPEVKSQKAWIWRCKRIPLSLDYGEPLAATGWKRFQNPRNKNWMRNRLPWRSTRSTISTKMGSIDS